MSAIAFQHLTKEFGSVRAVDDLTVDVPAGRITAFLGANGSGKTTSMRVLLGLSSPTSGTATVAGHAYASLPHPMRTVGAVLDQGFHPNRTARHHLQIVAAQAQVPRSRVDDTLGLVDLAAAADRRVGGFSLGMRQRLALASALIGDPSILVLDEPLNGLDPDGIQTMRSFLRQFADNGGTVFLSSHLLAEVAHTVDDAIIIHRGHLVTSGPVSQLLQSDPSVVVTTPDADLLAVTLANRGVPVTRTGPEQLTIPSTRREVIGRAALHAGAVILDMRGEGDDLETIFHTLTHSQETAS
jgi:ABC-2 type transport system ATP-binding protein